MVAAKREGRGPHTVKGPEIAPHPLVPQRQALVDGRLSLKGKSMMSDDLRVYYIVYSYPCLFYMGYSLFYTVPCNSVVFGPIQIVSNQHSQRFLATVQQAYLETMPYTARKVPWHLTQTMQRSPSVPRPDSDAQTGWY